METIQLPSLPDPFYINPKQWGSHGWLFMQYVALGYPNNPSNEQKSAYYNFFLSIGKVIPCKDCQVHYTDFEKLHSLEEALESKTKLTNWVYEAHNNANSLSNKPNFTSSQFLETYIQPLEARKKSIEISSGRIIGGGLLFISCIAIIGFSSSYLAKKKENKF